MAQPYWPALKRPTSWQEALPAAETKGTESLDAKMKTIVAKMGLHFDRLDHNPYLYYNLQISNHSLCHEHSPPPVSV